MPQKCSVCSHADKAKIDSAILRGESLRGISERYGPSPSSINRHKHGCMRIVLAEKAETDAERLRNDAEAIRNDFRRIADKAESACAYTPAVNAKRAELEVLKLMGFNPDDKPTDDDGFIDALMGAAPRDWDGIDPEGSGYDLPIGEAAEG